MKVSEMLKVSEKTDKEVCEQADKLTVEEYFENPDNLKIEDQEKLEVGTTIDPQDDWEVVQEEQKDEMVSLVSEAMYSTQDNRPRQMLLSSRGNRSVASSQAICLLDAQLAQEKKKRKDLESELNELKVTSMQFLDQDKTGNWTARKRIT